MRKLHGKEDTKISAAGLTFVFCFVVAVSFVIAANLRLYSMAKEVNPRLPKDSHISVWDRWRMYELLRLHTQMYPDSHKRWQMWTLALTGFVFLFAGFFAVSVLPH